MDLTNLVRSSGIKKDALRYGRLAGINVGNDPDITSLFE